MMYQTCLSLVYFNLHVSEAADHPLDVANLITGADDAHDAGHECRSNPDLSAFCASFDNPTQYEVELHTL